MLDRAKVKSLRHKLGLSQAQAAKAAGMTTAQHWSNVERGGTGYDVSMSTLTKIAKALKCKPGDLLK
jgi:transcriptional regulator with XRE-family HTH domain